MKQINSVTMPKFVEIFFIILYNCNELYHYRKLSANSPRGYLLATDAYTNCYVAIYNGVCISKLNL